MTSRRQFLIMAAASAASLGTPCSSFAREECVEWKGRALGSRVRFVLAGADPARTRHLFDRVEQTLKQVERQFSLHQDSDLVRLNQNGKLAYPSSDILELFRLADEVHKATEGAFDPTIQPLWQARAHGIDESAARKLVGWNRVTVTEDEIRLDLSGMALTFNGIAQGYAADRVSAVLRNAGYNNVLVDMGEISALGTRANGTPWQAGIALPDGTLIDRVALSNQAIATSSPRGTLIGPQHDRDHVMGGQNQKALWRLVSVAAPSAALADALSTAFCLLDQRQTERALAAFPGARLIKRL